MHMMKRNLLVTALACTAATASARDAELDFTLAAGYLHDTNVGITDIDLISAAADNALRFRSALEVSLPLGSRATATAGYAFERTAYEELATFDLDLHHASAGLALSIAGFDAAVTADRFDAVLAGEDYLSLTQVTPSFGRLFGTAVYTRVAWTDGTKHYDAHGARDAATGTLRGDAYFLLDGMDRYIAVNLQSGKEDAADDAFDYTRRGGTLAFGQTFGRLAGKSRTAPSLRAELGCESRAYDSVDEELGEARLDRRCNAGLILAVPLGRSFEGTSFEIKAEAARTHIVSNLPSAELDRTNLGLTVTATF